MTIKAVIAAAAVTTTTVFSAANAEEAPSVVLVHGAWANGASWEKVVPLLQAKGLTVVATHNPLSSFEADVAATRRVIDAQPGEVILVGHSYGGAVITEAGNSDKVRALVYVAAFAPDVGESVNSIVGEHGQPDWFSEIRPDAAGYLSWTPEGMAQFFAPDLPAEEVAVLAAMQGPTSASAFDGQITATAYSGKIPNFYVIADDDQVLPASLQIQFAERMGATITHVAASHAVALSQPGVVSEAILAAAGTR
jgi:pimeloyl-ACP methyl ester carboxylesterase